MQKSYLQQIQDRVGLPCHREATAFGDEKGLNKPLNEYILAQSTSRHPIQIAGFHLAPMPGCCGVVISSGAWVSVEYRGLGIGKLLNAMRMQLAWYYGYTLMLCTYITTNDPQTRILADNGWNDLQHFTNRRTGNPIALCSVLLKDSGIPIDW